MSTLTAQVERIQEQLQPLRLIRLAEELRSLLQDASKKNLGSPMGLELLHPGTEDSYSPKPNSGSTPGRFGRAR